MVSTFYWLAVYIEVAIVNEESIFKFLVPDPDQISTKI